jgi:hypothetical protein
MRCSEADVGYPVTHIALTGEDAGLLRRWHASDEDAAVLTRVRELAAGSVARVSTDQAWEPIRRCLVGYHPAPGLPAAGLYGRPELAPLAPRRRRQLALRGRTGRT